MQIKGIEKIREKVPDYPGRRIMLIPLRGIISALLGFVFMIFLDVAPRIFSDVSFLVYLEPFLPIIGPILLGGVAMFALGRLWGLRDEMKEKYGNLSYQKIIMTGIAGVSLVPAIIIHAFISVRSLPPIPPVNEITILWSQSLLPMIGIPAEIDLIIRVGVSIFLIIIGLMLVRSAIETFGVDYMVVIYLYFPEESEVQENEIYSVIRHPTYLAGILLGIAALFFRFSVYSFIFCFLGYLVFRLQIRREEKELIERFGDGYRNYMKRVPAFYVSPSNYGKFFRFLRGK